MQNIFAYAQVSKHMHKYSKHMHKYSKHMQKFSEHMPMRHA